MKQPIKKIQDISKALKEEYADRNRMFQKMDRMDRSEWELPSELKKKDFIRNTTAPDPAAAITTAVKVLGAETPKIKFTPTGPDPANRTTASKIERGLSWELKSAAKRSQTKLVPEIIRSSIKYAECAVYIDYLPWRVEKFDERRRKFVLRQGQFSLTPHNPQTVYPRYSDMGLEAVVAVRKQKASNVIDYYGDIAKDFVKYANKREEDFDVTIWDYTDFNQRLVWVWCNEDTESGKNDEFILIDEENKKGFIPWAIRMVGTVLDDEPSYQRKPFLDIVNRAKLWEDMNVMGTLINSEVLTYAAAPRDEFQGADSQIDQVSIDYGEANKPLRVPMGVEHRQLTPNPIDRALTEIYDRTKAKLEAATSVQVLQNLNFPAGTAYATINAVLQTAIASLQPYKVLAQDTLVDIFEIMLLWIDHANGEIVSYGTGENKESQQFVVTKNDFSPSAIYIDVELNASAPTDFLQRINAGTLLYQLGMPLARVFEDLNVPDPEQAMIERTYEDMERNEVQLNMQQREAERQMQIQQMMMALQQMAQQGPQGPPQGVPPQSMMQGPPPSPGFTNVEGAGFNPNMGGEPPTTAAPGLTREELNQTTSGGEPIAEI